MTTKKQSTKKGVTRGKAEGRKGTATQRGWPPALEERAREIIADAGVYDERTREAMRCALEEGNERLPDMVKTAEILAAGEPADKTSDAWRYWKLRQIEAGFDGGDTVKYGAAWDEFWKFFDGYRVTGGVADTDSARRLLPTLISARQAAEMREPRSTGRRKK
jgi:hypothetical protein